MMVVILWIMVYEGGDVFVPRCDKMMNLFTCMSHTSVSDD